MLLTVKDLAARWQIKPSTLYAWAARGEIPAVKLNGLVRFHPVEIERWLDASKKAAPQRRLKNPRSRPPAAVDALIAQAHRAVYTPRHGETRPTSSPIGKEEQDGAL